VTEPVDTLVECYSGHTYAQEPRALVWQGQRYQVVRVEDRWRTPEGPAFRILAEPTEMFELHYYESKERWTVRTLPDAHGDLDAAEI
jgi:hypothetical protein